MNPRLKRFIYILIITSVFGFIPSIGFYIAHSNMMTFNNELKLENCFIMNYTYYEINCNEIYTCYIVFVNLIMNNESYSVNTDCLTYDKSPDDYINSTWPLNTLIKCFYNPFFNEIIFDIYDGLLYFLFSIVFMVIGLLGLSIFVTFEIIISCRKL
jgi:hypothetical protein